MDTQTKTAPVSDTGENSFHVLLSSPGVDRDGESLALSDWKTPLPQHIPFSADHQMNTDGMVGSGQPQLTAAGLEVHGEWADTPRAQHVRGLVRSGHIRNVSVEFLRHKSADGSVRHELLGGSFVYVPSNPEAKILSSKAGARNSAADSKMIQAIHDASCILGANCVTEAAPDLDDGSDDGANKAIGAAVEAKAKLLRMRLAL